VGLDEAGLLARLTAGPAAPALPPAWWRTLDRLFPEAAAAMPPVQGSTWQAAFAPVLTPFLNEARTGLAAALQPLIRQGRVDRGRIELQCLGELRARLLNMVARPLVLELNAARLLGRLEGVTPAERFLSFAAGLVTPAGRLDFYREYPVLARFLAEYVEQWRTALGELFERLDQDWERLAGRLNGGRDPGALQRVRLAGDRHRQGRSVALCSFASGFTTVYKPRPVSVEGHLQALLAWLDGRQPGPAPGLAFRTFQVIDRGRYGWVETVPHRPCSTPEEVERFYGRQGANLAVLHALGGTDMHADNIIASGEHPVVVDAEALFDTRPAGGAVPERASVLRIGLLPHGADTDLSGLGGAGGQLSVVPVAAWASAGADTMRQVRQRMPLAGFQNLPSLAGADGNIEPRDHLESMLEGFRSTYRRIVAHREALTAPGGPLDAFAPDEVRVVLRSTSFYSWLLEESLHPGALGDGLDRDRLLDRLWLETAGRPDLEWVAEAERADLWSGDVPVFLAHPGSTDLRSSRGAVLPGFFAQSGLATARERIGRLGEEDLEVQLGAIRTALESSL
jgi:type 2 lantibiotic biosynthesis protein LanM